MSLGALRRLPSHFSASTSTAPFSSVRVTRRVRVSQVYRRPCGVERIAAGAVGSLAKDFHRLAGHPLVEPVGRSVAEDEEAVLRPGGAFGKADVLDQLIELDF